MNAPNQPRPPDRPPVPPPPGAPPTEVFGSEGPPRGPWWQQGWGLALIALVALLVGLGGGLAIGKSSNNTTTTTASGPNSPVTHTITNTVQHTQTVVSTHTVTVTKEGSEGGEGSGETQSFHGSGSKNLGTIKVSSPSALRWTSEGESFAITSSRGELLSSEGRKGTASLAPGTYADFEVQADSGWTLTITPGG